jgi:hypothetical protein
MPETIKYDETAAEKKKRMDPDGLLSKVGAWQSKSKADLSSYQNRWAGNLRILKGTWDVDEKNRSQVRGRSKIYFRKVWSTVWRLMASLYNAFLRDPDQFRVEGRMGDDQDVHKAGILQILAEYRRDVMYREQDLFLQHIWGMQNILTHGVAVGLFSWEYNKTLKKDGPRFKVFPPEQVFPDMDATMESEMQHIIFESYHTMEELTARGYDNLDQIQPTSPENTPLRTARYQDDRDPMLNPGDKEYPTPGRYGEANAENGHIGKYRVWQSFYREQGRVYYCVTNGPDVVMKKSEVSKYGDQIPCVFGVCLTEPHKLIGEGFPEPLEGPQLSLNDVINRRKDNVALAMNQHSIVSRFGNVDLASLQNSRAGAVTLADDVNAVRERESRDVTQSAYVEAQADEGMMQEMSGVTASKSGMDNSTKTGVAQINLTESNAKIDLFIAIIGETWMRKFHQKLVYLIQRFETDEKFMRVANKKYREKAKVDHWTMPYDITDVDDFDADVIVETGVGSVNRDMEIKNAMLAMDRAVMANQSMIQLLATGAVPKQEMKLFDTSKFMTEKILPKIGFKNTQDYLFAVAPPPPQAPAGGGRSIQGAQAPAGALAPAAMPIEGPGNAPMGGGPSGF